MDFANVNFPIPGFSTKLSPIYTVSINMGFSISQNQCYRGTSWIFIKIRKVSPKICFLKSFFLMRLYISEFIFPANIDFRFMDSIELENIFCHFPKFTKLVTSQHSYTKRIVDTIWRQIYLDFPNMRCCYFLIDLWSLCLFLLNLFQMFCTL